MSVVDKFTYSGVRSNLDSLAASKKIDVIQGDICDSSLLLEILPSFDAVINFAAESHVDRSILSSREFINTNTLGVQVILDAILSLKKNIRFLQVSTDEIYGSINSGSWKESEPMQPNSPYAASKAGGELIARSYYVTHGLDVVISRCSNNYGPRHFPEKLIPLAITNIISGEKVPIYGDGKNVRDWIHVYDHCRALNLILQNAKSGSVYNIGGGVELSNHELVSKILAQMNVSQDMIEFVPDRKGHDQRYSVNAEKIKSDLSFQPIIDFDDGLKETIDWYQKNLHWWQPIRNIITS
jgi:dTDP-glucose 4,6-dehydratase